MEKNKGIFKKILTVLVLTAVFTAALAIVLMHDNILELLGVSGYAEMKSDYYYDNCSGGAFAVLGDCFAAASNTDLVVFGSDGDEIFSQTYSYSEPRLTSDGSYGAVYDIGGNSLLFFNGDGILFSLAPDYAIISANVNSDGYLALSTQESGYLGSVTVYNRNGTAIYKWYSGSARLLSAQVIGDSEFIAVTIGNTGSHLVKYSLDAEDVKARYDCSGIAVGAVYSGGYIAFITTDYAVWLDGNLREISVYDFSDKYLVDFDVKDSFAAFILSDFQMGGGEDLITVNRSGEVIGQITLPDNAVCMSASSKGIAVLFSDSVRVYDKYLGSIEILGTDGAERVIYTDSGSVITAGAFSAHAEPVEDTSAE